MSDSAQENQKALPPALAMLSSERPRNINWFQSAALLFGDWGTSRLYVLGLAFLVAGRSSFWLIAAMSLLILAVGWAYTHICRLYPDGGGVYTAGRRRHAVLGVIGALLLFADYTITASLSSIEAFHYFGIGHETAQVVEATGDPGEDIHIPDPAVAGEQAPLWDWHNPGIWAIASIMLLGAFNLLGPKHTAGFAIFAAVGMIAITLLIVGFALPQIDWRNIDWGKALGGHRPLDLWQAFVYIVLALSGVEAIANLTGVMKKPVYGTASRAIWLVAIEVAVFNLLLAIVMISLAPAREAHTEDMLAYMALQYIGPWGEWPVRILGGMLLLSATNTAVNGLMSITYVMSRDGELPPVFQRLNAFGAPWVAAILAASVPIMVLFVFHDLERLAALYAVGVVGAVALDSTLAATHPRLRGLWRKIAILALGIFLAIVWLTLAFTKWHATAFVAIVLTAGLTLRAVTRFAARRRPRPSLFRRAVIEQLPEQACSGSKVLLATAGSATLADAAIEVAKRENAALVVCFVRDVALSHHMQYQQNRLTLDNDAAALALFTDFLEAGHRAGVAIIPAYDTGSNGAELIAEIAAINGVSRVLIGSSRRGTLHKMIKGSFQQKLESLLPPEIPVEVLEPTEPVTQPVAAA